MLWVAFFQERQQCNIVADRYYFDFRNASMRKWYVAEYFGDETGLANPNVDG